MIRSAKVSVVLTLMIFSLPVFGQEPPALVHQCFRGSDRAEIQVIPERSKGELPCQVVFTPLSGVPRTLWRVTYERGLCVQKADRKRDLLEAEGWQCETTAQAPWADAARSLAKADQASPSAREDTASGTLIDDERRADLESLLHDTGSGRSVSLSLEEAVSLALRHSREIEGGYLTRVRDELNLAQSEDQFRPDLTIEAGPDWDDERGTSGEISSSISNALPTGGEISLSWANQLDDQSGNSNVGAEISQPLLRGGGLDANLASIRQARLAYQSGELSLISTVAGTITSVILAHRSLNLAQIELDVAEWALQRSKEQKDISQKLFDAGRIPRLDLLQNDAEIASREVDLVSSRLALDDARRGLLDVLDFETKVTLLAEDSTTDREIRLDLETALEIAYTTRPDFLQAQLSDEGTRLGLDVARSESRWGLDAVAGADYQDSLYDRSGFAGDANDVNYRAGLRLSIPFGDVARRQSVGLAKLDIEQEKLSLVELTKSIETEIVNQLTNLDNLKRQIALAERAERLAGNQLDAERTKFSRGLSSTLDLISLEDALVDAQRATYGTRVSYSNALTELDQALGTTLESWSIQLRAERWAS